MSAAPLAGVGPDAKAADDPALEVAAIALEAVTWNTPDDVVGMLTSPAARTDLETRWLERVDAPTRSLYRRRAAIARAALKGDL